MDAAEEKDAALQRSSSDLLVRFTRSLPKFLWHRTPSSSPKVGSELRLKSVVRLSALGVLTKLVGSPGKAPDDFGCSHFDYISWNHFKNGLSSWIPN